MKHICKKQTRNGRKSERGAALVVVLLLLMTLTLVGVGSLRTAAMDYIVTSNRSLAHNAAKVARAGVHIVITQFRRPELDLLSNLVNRQAIIGGTSECEKAQTLCFTAASFFTKTSSTSLPHHGFRVDAFMPFSNTLVGSTIPTSFGDYLVVVNQPIRSGSQAMPGYSIGSKMCTYTVTLTATGYILNPNETNNKSYRYILGERTYKVYIKIPATGSTLCS